MRNQVKQINDKSEIKWCEKKVFEQNQKYEIDE